MSIVNVSLYYHSCFRRYTAWYPAYEVHPRANLLKLIRQKNIAQLVGVGETKREAILDLLSQIPELVYD